MISPASHLTYPPTIECCRHRFAPLAALVATVAMSAVLPDDAAAQGGDPRCRDRAARGRFTCVIEQPPVRRPETLVPDVVFAPGDTVRISATGCVNVSRETVMWRRYVDPRGPNSENLYHGLIRIPTATAGFGLVRIQDVVSRPLVVRGGLPPSELVLYLGYEDIPLDYGDNHYDGPRDHRAGSQCQGSGPARVSLTIVRRGQAESAQSDLQFNLEWTALDPNGFPLNPWWAWQPRHPKEPPPSAAICHYFSRKLPFEIVPDFDDCTDQTDLSRVDMPGYWVGAVCSVGGPGFSGHLNWFTVTYEGTAAGRNFHWNDGDYSVQLVPPGGSGLLNGDREFHTEFDSDESVNQFGSRWWRLFRITDLFGSGTPETLLQGTPIIMTGLFGLDCVHDCQSELHPVYALAAHVRDNPTHDVWAIFVRNAGNEGICSSHIWEAPFQTYTFRLPWRAGMDSVRVRRGVDETEFTGTQGTSGPTVRYTRGRGVDVTFRLPPPADRPHIDGALHLQWFGTPAARIVAAPVLSARQTEAEGDAEERLDAAYARLSPAQRRQVDLARPRAAQRPVQRLAETGPAVAQPVALATARRAAVLLGTRGPLAARKLARDSAWIRALCAASGDSIAGLPRRVCTLPPPR